ncbi:SAM-dependent DNA methyltransferase [Lichenibacterium minor]|uniref:site-specific DNA-methyltransferase (adenine-specific) n=1 Tax=Lichenibacterium minor TaxID=2316528 RepID=A0A4Q2UCS1_9HYPH|nr:N-6 DNA methylase [Lichenibacterium minor]RYC33898.1 SAM-dependent DNA methyltransferase [Lichenibacterium minor]
MSNAVERALVRTGFVVPGGGDVEGLFRDVGEGGPSFEPAFARRSGLAADAVYSSGDGPKLIVKGSGVVDAEVEFDAWHERAWNLGLAPLLWIVTPVDVRVYDAFSGVGDGGVRGPLRRFLLDVDEQMAELEAFCGRFSLDTGAFWASGLARGIDRSRKVDRVLLDEIRALEQALLPSDADGAGRAVAAVERARCQELVTCTLFASYLFDRGIAQPMLPVGITADLVDAFTDQASALQLFDWLTATFNGDVFPPGTGDRIDDAQVGLLRDFVQGTGISERDKGQLRLFRFRFDTVPIDLISSVYETFARRAVGDSAKRLGLHYTPVELVHMALDPVFERLPTKSRVLDPTCGSGLFLVEALRRLVWTRCRDGIRPRRIVRQILYGQVYGIDVNSAALRIAAFSLYLAALELETEAEPGEGTRFDRLIGRTLFECDFLSAPGLDLARSLHPHVIVGNPPWTHGALGTRDDEPHTDEDEWDERGNVGLENRMGAVEEGRDGPTTEEFASRAPDQRFFAAAVGLSEGRGRIAMYLKTTAFLSSAANATRFRDGVLRRINRLALLDLSSFRHAGLFSKAQAPGLLVCGNCPALPTGGTILVGSLAWDPDFARSGAITISSAEMRTIPKVSVIGNPSLMKASMLGTPRDARLIERLTTQFPTFGQVVGPHTTSYGQGFQMKSKGEVPPKLLGDWMGSLPALMPKDYSAITLDGCKMDSLPERGIHALHRERRPRLYQGPLVVFPKSAHAKALQKGRTSAALHTGDLAFSHGFYGFSFAGRDRRWAVVVCALLNSAVPGFQLLFGAGPLGFERPSVNLTDLLGIRFPIIDMSDELAERATAAMATARSDDCAVLCSCLTNVENQGLSFPLNPRAAGASISRMMTVLRSIPVSSLTSIRNVVPDHTSIGWSFTVAAA